MSEKQILARTGSLPGFVVAEEMQRLDNEYRQMTGLPSLLINGSVHEAILLLQPLPADRPVKAVIADRFGARAAELISRICELQRECP